MMRTSTCTSSVRRRAGTCAPGARAAASPASPRHLADLVEEERAAVGELEQPLLVASAPVNAPRMWPNSSDSRRFSGIAPQLSDDERLVAPQRVEVDRPRDQFLAGARLPGQQDGAVGAGDRLDHPEHREHRLAAADDVGELVREPSARFSSRFSCLSWRFSSFWRTFILSTSMLNGLVR